MKEKYYEIADKLNESKGKSGKFISDKVLEVLKIKVNDKVVYVKK